jgi:hypothetical protein
MMDTQMEAQKYCKYGKPLIPQVPHFAQNAVRRVPAHHSLSALSGLPT